jgi:hypothetical protein
MEETGGVRAMTVANASESNQLLSAIGSNELLPVTFQI